MSWPLIPKVELQDLCGPQLRMLVKALQVECDRIDNSSPGFVRDKRLKALVDWLETVWPVLDENLRHQAIEAADQREAA